MRRRTAWLVPVVAILHASLLWAQTVDRHGAPSVACAPDGGFVVVWQSRGQDGDDYGIVGQRFDSTGGTRGTEFLINTYTTDSQLAPAVCMDATSAFVVVWESYGQGHDGYGVFARRFDSTGRPRFPEFQVPTSSDNQENPDVACGTIGEFVVVWSGGGNDGDDYGIRARGFTSDGSSVGGDFAVNSYTTMSQVLPSVQIDGSGNFVVAWGSYDGEDGDGYGIFVRRFASDLSPLGSEMQVNTYTMGDQLAPALGVDAAGRFVVAWSSAQDTDPGYDVFGQRFASTGAREGTEFQVNTYTTGDQGVSLGNGRVLDVAASDNGFVIVWQSTSLSAPTQDGDGIGVFAQRYAGTPAEPVGTEFRVNTTTAGDQAFPSVCSTASGAFVVAWESRDADIDAIFAQRYDSSGGVLGPEIRVSSDTAHRTRCPGDCDGSHAVGVNELVTGVNIALSQRPVGDCAAFDTNGSDTVSVDELVTAVGAALHGCPDTTPTPSFTPTPMNPERTGRSNGRPPRTSPPPTATPRAT